MTWRANYAWPYVEVRTDWFFGKLFLGQDDIHQSDSDEDTGYIKPNQNSIESFAAWWRAVEDDDGGGGNGGGGDGGGGGGDYGGGGGCGDPGAAAALPLAWRSITAYRFESLVVVNQCIGGTGAGKAGNANVRAWADRVGLAPLTVVEAACVLTVLAGMRPTPQSSACFAWQGVCSERRTRPSL